MQPNTAAFLETRLEESVAPSQGVSPIWAPVMAVLAVIIIAKH